MVPVQADHDGGQRKLLGKARGGDADGPLVPAVTGQNNGSVGGAPLQLSERVVPNVRLDALPLTVEIAKLNGKLGSLLRPGGHQQVGRLGGLPQTPGGVEARGQVEADVARGDAGVIHPGLPQHGGKTGTGRF